MEVSHVKDHVTHAVIGGGQNIGFGISDSAEFFNILSSTLYKNQKLAVVREVLCNAWDAHIAAGKQDVPVQITLTRDEFIIRDYGLGIPHDKIGPIYTVYGNSTKKHDGQQTGGFGLGCKAPFAYTDHFEVISWSEGKKSIYNVSKSAAEVMGKPGMKLIMQTDCGTETGLQVRIKLKTSEDRTSFNNLIRTIARNGEMNMEMNHEKLETIPFSKMTLDFLVTTRQLIDGNYTLMVRYGNVIYPISDNEGFAVEYKEVWKIMEALRGNRYARKAYHLVLQAPPHSISVTPSREELSMQEHTVGTLKKLLAVFAQRFNVNYVGEATRLLDQCLDQVWTKKEYNELLTEEERIPGNVTEPLSDQSQITTIPALVRYHSVTTYPKIPGYRTMEILKRIDSMIANGWGNRGLLQAYRECIKAGKDVDRYTGDMKWFYDHIASPLTRGMERNELLDPKRLFTVGYGIRGGDYRLASSKHTREMIREITSLESLPIIKYWPFLRNIVVLSYTRNDVADRVSRFPEIQDRGGKMNYGFMLYVVPRNMARVEAARKHFQSKHGVVFIDLTVAAEWEHKAIAEPTEKVYVRRKKQEGWPAVTNILMPTGGISMDNARHEGAARITEPKWFTSLGTKTKHNRSPQQLGRYDNKETKIILSLFGSTGAVSLSKLTQEKLLAAGAKPMEIYVRDMVIQEVSNSERIGQHLVEHQCSIALGDLSDHLQMICESTVLRDVFGLGESLNQREKDLLVLWNDIKSYCVDSYYTRSNHEPAVELNRAIEELKIPNVLVDLMTRIRSSELLEFLDVSYLSSAFSKSSDAGLIKRALNLYLQALNN